MDCRDRVAVPFGSRLLTAFAAPNLAPRICAGARQDNGADDSRVC